MAAGPSTVLSGLSLTAAEVAAGYSVKATDGGYDNYFLLQETIIRLNEAASTLTALNAGMPAGSNKTAIAAQLALLVATS